MSPVGGLGVARNTPPQYSHGLWIDGEWFEDGLALPISGYDYSPGGVVIPMVAGTRVQLRILGGDAPCCLEPTRWSVSFTVRSLASERLFRDRANFGTVVPFYFDHEWTDVWYVPAKIPGQTLWKCSRRLPYGLVPNITHLVRPPEVQIDGVTMTVVEGTSGDGTLPPAETPSAGQVIVPTYSPAGVGGIKTRSDLAGVKLKMYYHPVIVGLIKNLRVDYRTQNHARLSCEVHEHMSGIYIVP